MLTNQEQLDNALMLVEDAKEFIAKHGPVGATRYIHEQLIMKQIQLASNEYKVQTLSMNYILEGAIL